MLAVAAAFLPTLASAVETPGRDSALTGNGRHLQPVGRQTDVGTFPTGGALSPDGRFYWTVDAGRGPAAVRIVDVASGDVLQTLPIPGGYVGIAFAPDGRHAYVSGQPAEGSDKTEGLKGKGGDVVHVFAVDAKTGKATEADPLALPNARDGAAANDELPPASGVAAWPEGLAVSHDGNWLVVALGQADQVAIFDLQKGGDATLANVGRYPYGVVADPRRARAYVTNERDGTVSAVDLPSGKAVATIDVGGAYAHAEGIAADPLRDRVYVAVTDRDKVAVVDTAALKLERSVDVSRDGVFGTAPVSPTVSPDGDTLYVADAGADEVAAIALEARPASTPKPKTIIAVRSTSAIAKYRREVDEGEAGARPRPPHPRGEGALPRPRRQASPLVPARNARQAVRRPDPEAGRRLGQDRPACARAAQPRSAPRHLRQEGARRLRPPHRRRASQADPGRALPAARLHPQREAVHRPRPAADRRLPDRRRGNPGRRAS